MRMGLDGGVSYKCVGRRAGTEGRRTTVPTHLRAKQQKSKRRSWSGLRRENVPLGAHTLPGLSPSACSKSPLAFGQKCCGFFKVKSSAQIHKSHLQHPRTWHVFCQWCCLFRALAVLCTTHGDTSVSSSNFFQHFCCDTLAV